jgi:hypothetical protein
MLAGMSNEKSVDETRGDNEAIMEQRYDIGVFDKKKHQLNKA